MTTDPILTRPITDDRARFDALLALPDRGDWELRPGGQTPTNLYAHTTGDPKGVPVGRMDTVWLAQLVCDAVNTHLAAQRVEGGGRDGH